MNTIIRRRLRLSPKLLLYSFPKSSFFFFSTTTSDSVSFTISYLTNTCGFTREAALKLSKRLRFNTAQKPDSVISFFQTHGFSAAQIHRILSLSPELMVCNPTRRLLPKFHFLASKGFSASDVVSIVAKNPRFLCQSLENRIFPTFQLIRRFFPSDLRALAVYIACPSVIGHCRVASNVERLLDAGVSHAGIRHLLSSRPLVLCFNLRTPLEEVKLLGFDPLKVTFAVALVAKRTVSKPLWDAKVAVLKKWGWSEDEVLVAFRKQPTMMLCSLEKLDAVAGLWAGRLGWDRSALIAYPSLFLYSLEKRLVPRALVLQHLLSRGLVKKDANFVTPFCRSDEGFLEKYVTSFEEETPRLLELYQKGQGAC
ncbi:nucleolar protein 12 [Vigna unguiculata]|uniref:Nucleolar protein 12 n=1 Tax=Vigna unguiculata TaxID=3917 RepID=A0A4D6MKB8_VIGUN|nr:nucleolar protein 12 [Vigna unguiculata]